MKRKSFTWASHAWTPVRRRNIYCSPACGGNCLFSSYKQAHEKGKKLAKQCGENFTYEVWENLGWHFKAVSNCKSLSVYPSNDHSFWADLHINKNQYCLTRSTPQKAITDVIKTAKNHLATLKRGLSKLKI